MSETAETLLASHGLRARQKIVDEIVRCIREHNLAGAKAWDEVGRAVDRALKIAGNEKDGQTAS